MTIKPLREIDKQAAALLGLKPEVIAKTQARQNFLPLVDSLSQKCSAIEITDHNKPVAVLLSYHHWAALLSKLTMLSKKEHLTPPVNLIGSVKIVGDLEAASKETAERFSHSINETSKKL